MTAEPQHEQLLAQELAHADSPQDRVAAVCRVAMRILDAAGVAVSLSIDETSGGPVIATDGATHDRENLQLDLGEGPCHLAVVLGEAVQVPDVGADDARWSAWSAAAQRLGVGSVLALPLGTSTARLGSLSVYRDTPGALEPRDRAWALALARVASRGVVEMVEDGFDDTSGAMLRHRHEVHQAQGMVMAQLEVDATDALARLRAHAWLHDRSLVELARDVVTRTVRLGRDDPGSDSRR